MRAQGSRNARLLGLRSRQPKGFSDSYTRYLLGLKKGVLYIGTLRPTWVYILYKYVEPWEQRIN